MAARRQYRQGKYPPSPQRKQRMERFTLFIFLIQTAAAVCLQGCHLPPSALYRPVPPLAVQENRPKSLSAPAPSAMITVDRWWEEFNRPVLNRLVQQALTDNFSIHRAGARLTQARTTAAAQEASRFPLLDLDLGMTHTNTSGTSDTLFSAGPAASYEVDLWGKVTADITAARLEARASRYDLNAAAMSVAAEVADTWVNLMAARRQLELSRQQLALNRTVLSLMELRFANAMSTALDVLQQREVVAGVQAEIPPAQSRIITLENTLMLLLGSPRDLKISDSTGSLPLPLTPLPEAGLPIRLLAHRPDVQAAVARLQAADQAAFSAHMDRLPDLTLTGSFRFRDSALDLILQNWILSLASTLSTPLFDAGKKAAMAAHADAVTAEALAACKETMATAIVEVDNRLAAERHQHRHLVLLEQELAAARKALKEARYRYINGLDPFIPFLTEQVNVQQLESRLIEQKAQLVRYRIALYRALGGHWTPKEIFP